MKGVKGKGFLSEESSLNMSSNVVFQPSLTTQRLT